MLAYAFPPVLASGTARSVAFSRNLPAFGWEPTVLTVDRCRDTAVLTGELLPEGVRIVRAHEVNLHALLENLHGLTRKTLGLLGIDLKKNYYRELVVPDPQLAWLSWLKGIPLARARDVIYASCSPFSSALAGCALKRVSGKPLVVDFRDPWSLNPYRDHISFHEGAVRFLERFVLRNCDVLILNTEGTEELYRKHYPEWQSKIVYIPNGYDVLTPVEKSVGPTFRIMHIGNFYGSRGPDALLESLSEISDRAIEFVQVGLSSPALERAKNVNVRVIPSVPRERALELMKTASLLYLKQGVEAGSPHYVSVAAKTYEYLATGLPVLADCPEGDNADIVRKYCAYPYVVTSGNRADIKTAILDARSAHASMIPKVTPEFVERFDRVRLTRQLAGIFDRLTVSRLAVEQVSAYTARRE